MDVKEENESDLEMSKLVIFTKANIHDNFQYLVRR
jgi:hypothetical protein